MADSSEFGVQLMLDVSKLTEKKDLEKRISDCRFRQCLSGNKADWLYWQKEIRKCQKRIEQIDKEVKPL